MTKTFRDLGVDGALCDALATEGITHPFPIQELTLPLALTGNDLIGQARTGTGKTLAFGLPLLQRLDPERPVTQALVIVPTRELCLQVFEDLKIGAAKGLRSIAVYGGVGYDEQIDALTSGVHVVVGTPGRLLDHLNRGNLDLSNVTQLVLDEADEMLDMGFLADVERLVEACAGENRHTMLFSATMPTAIVKLARRYMDHPTFTRADTEAHETAPNVTQYFLQVHRMDKPRVLARILQSPERGGVYVFVRTKHMADRLVNELEELRIPAIPIHGDLRQSAREKNLDRFREGKATVLVATEVAARGLDVTGVTHVVNYDCPDDEKMYLHRIGRTARAGEAGVAVTFAEFNEVDKLNVIRKAVGAANTQVEQVFSTSDVLTELFELPDEKPWAHLSKKTTGGGGRRQATSERAKGERGAAQERGSGARRGTETGRGDRQGRREGRSDGRPKSDRRAEGAGAAHDAATRERPGRDRRSETPAAATSTSEKPTAGKPTTEKPTTEKPTAEKPTEDRGRTRERTRTRRSAADAPTVRRDASRGDASPTGAQPSGAGREAASSGSAPSDAAPSKGRQRARGGQDRTRARDTGRATTPAPEGEREDRGEGSRSGSRRDRGRSSRGGSGRGGADRGGSGRPQRDERDAANGAEREPIKLQERGAEARGEGQPQLSRRVKVEHLP